MLDLDMIESKRATHSGHLAGPWVSQLIAEIRELRQLCALRASGDPDVRNVLLYQFGTTDPEMLQDACNNLYESNLRLQKANTKMLAVLDKLWADKDAPQEDQAAARRLYNAWLDLRDVRNEIHANGG